jgi:hypothetical protein
LFALNKEGLRQAQHPAEQCAGIYQFALLDAVNEELFQ